MSRILNFSFLFLFFIPSADADQFRCFGSQMLAKTHDRFAIQVDIAPDSTHVLPLGTLGEVSVSLSLAKGLLTLTLQSAAGQDYVVGSAANRVQLHTRTEKSGVLFIECINNLMPVGIGEYPVETYLKEIP